MRYLCWTVYGYARRFLASRQERLRAYRMIDTEFQHCYPYTRYLYDRTVTRRYRAAKTAVRKVVSR
jgi:hypothetical protein